MNEFVTLADHEAGFKIIEVTHRSGASERVKLTAPTRRQSRLIGEAILREQDSWPVVSACRPMVIEVIGSKFPVSGSEAATSDDALASSKSPEPETRNQKLEASSPYGEAWLDKLTPPSADLVEVTAFALTFGHDFQKKMLAAAKLWMTASEKPAPKSTSPAAATP